RANECATPTSGAAEYGFLSPFLTRWGLGFPAPEKNFAARKTPRKIAPATTRSPPGAMPARPGFFGRLPADDGAPARLRFGTGPHGAIRRGARRRRSSGPRGPPP